MFGRGPKLPQKQRTKDIKNDKPTEYYEQNREYKAFTIKNERNTPHNKQKTLKTLVPPMQKVMPQRQKKCLSKMASAKSLEYTFGFSWKFTPSVILSWFIFENIKISYRLSEKIVDWLAIFQHVWEILTVVYIFIRR